MAVTVEFSVPPDAFPFGRSVSGDPNVTVTLESVVPLGGARIPFLWATRDGPGRFERFERHLSNSDIVDRVEGVTRTGDRALYRVDWNTDEETFLNGLADANGTIIEGRANGTVTFTVRFSDHADLTRFHEFYQSHDVPVHIDRVYTYSDGPGDDFGFGLTDAQREALVMAVEDGYFAVPRETKLEAIAGELDITRQAASELVRRGTETVLRNALLGLSDTDFATRSGEGSSPQKGH